MVTVMYHGRIPDLCGATEDRIDAKTVSDVMRHVRRSYPAEVVREAKKMLIVVNGESILQRRVFRTKLEDGDVVGFLPICGGG